MPAEPWTGTVACRHLGVLARTSTVASWSDARCCDEVDTLGRWRVGVDSDHPDDQHAVRRALAALQPLGLTASASLARLSRQDLPPCSVLLSDGDGLAGIAWGRPLGLIEIDRWEYAITARPQDGLTWRPIAPGTLVDLADCGPTHFFLPCPHTVKESA